MRRYDCPKSLITYVVVFPSLQCDMSACSGDRHPITFRENCESCDNYVANAQERDYEEVDKPLRQAQQKFYEDKVEFTLF